MRASLILTVSGPDRPGLVESLADVVTQHGGNWEESRMSRLAGQFAGVVHVTVAPEKLDVVASAARSIEGLEVSVRSGDSAGSEGKHFELEVVGADHEGIVSRISSVLASGGVSIDELWTGREEAPHAGGMLFRARATLRAPNVEAIDRVRDRLEKLASEVMVEIWID
ncbi:MAG: ACT domain-containing protein [Myxococcota bacterium]